MAEFASLPEKINFSQQEAVVLDLWKRLDAFRTSLKLSEGKPEYIFYDGPPFATGLPHYGHILAGTIKDIVTRYATQTGHYVSRRFGWDCHGLPVEYEIDKKLNIKGRDDVLAMGIDKYNAECRSIVTRYCAEWEVIVTRLGRWIDFANDYKTMEPWYMESVWWVFKSLFEKNLVYRSFKVMPYSTACNTPLSNFEAGQNYHEDTIDPAVVVSFPREDDPTTSFVAWTTTPWTLPSNLALCVHPELDYVTIRDLKTERKFTIAKSRLVQLYPKCEKKDYVGGEFEQLSVVKGAALVGVRYKPLFNYFVPKYGAHAFRVLSDTYVTDDAGTGIVHQAPAFGEDDWRVCTTHGVIAKDSGELPCPVDANGRFTEEVTDFVGEYVKDADDKICAKLKAEGRLIQKGTLTHSYPFCWRSDTPLIYRAVPSWFVRVEAIKDRLIANNEKTYWVPDAVKSGRFANWLKDARDWAISRNRYWGTPLPIWISADGEEVVVIGSIKELEERSGVKVTDLHRENIDNITIPSACGKGDLHRVDEVFDCWFESGSMPYAQIHYPFENNDRFRLPADFIAEGLDQTRGWFYTLMVLSTALFDAPAFKNLIVNGLVLAEDGKKMSKRLKNYPDPMHVVEKYGADALRLYLIDSPVVRGDPLKFKESGVLGVVKDLFLPWYNALRFFSQNADRIAPFEAHADVAAASTNIMDKWIVAAVHNLIKFVRDEMAAYRLYTVVPRLVGFIRNLTNWYVRLNRRRFKGGDGDDEARVSLTVLHGVLLDVARLMSPFTPFLSEAMYQHLRRYVPAYSGPDAATTVGSAESVHYVPVPDFDATRIDEAMERRVDLMQEIIELGRLARDNKRISLKTPVSEIVVIAPTAAVLEDAKMLGDYIKEELNALSVITTADDMAWCTLIAEANAALLGRRLGGDFRKVSAAIAGWSHEQVLQFQRTGAATVESHSLSGSDITVKRVVKPTLADKYEAVVSSSGDMLVAINHVLDDRLRSMATAREMCTRVQKLRKKAGLVPTDLVTAYYSVEELTHEEFVEAQKHQAEDEEAAAGAGSEKAGKPAVAAAAAAAGKKGGKGGDAKAASKGADVAVKQATGPEATKDARAAAVANLHTAVVANQAFMRDTLRVHVLPDVPAARPAHAVVLIVETDILNGAHLKITLTKESVRFPVDDAKLVALVSDAAKAAGLTLPAQSSAHAAGSQGPFGSVRIANGMPPAGEPVVVPAGASLAPPSIESVVVSAKYALAATEFSKLVADAKAGPITVRLDGLTLSLSRGQHFFTSVEESLALQPQLKKEWAAAPGGIGAALFDALVALHA